MSLETLFTLANAAVIPGWLMLVLAPRWRPGTDVVAPMGIPGLLAVGYLALFAFGPPAPAGASFSSLAGVKAMLGSEPTLLAGWIHYLAFDLVVGSWEVRDARAHGVRHLLVVPCLVFTFLLGPIGYLAYLGVRRTGTAAEAA